MTVAVITCLTAPALSEFVFWDQHHGFTVWHKNHTVGVSTGFSSQGPTQVHWTPRCFTETTTLSPAKPTPARLSLTQKRELFTGPASMSPVSFALPASFCSGIARWQSNLALPRAYVESKWVWTTFIHFAKPELPEIGSDQTQSRFKLTWDQYTGRNERTILWIFFYEKRLKHIRLLA